MAEEGMSELEAKESELIFKLELFASLPPRLRKLLLKFRRYTSGRADQVFVHQGEYTEDFHYVLSGSISAYRTELDGKTELFEFLGGHSWFGEASAISNQPSLATYKADVPCTLLSLDGGTFKILYKDPTNQEFRKRIDERYRRQSLAAHMRTMPIFKGLPKDQLAALKSEARFETHPKGKLLAREGEAQDAIYMVRSGAISCTRKLPSGVEQVLEYHMNNSSFGERSLAEEDARWPGSYTTLAPTDLLVISRAAIRSTLGEGTGKLAALERAALALVQETSGTGAGPEARSEDELEVLVKGGRVKGGEALVIDLQRCVRCNMCVETCVAVHEDRVPRLSKKGQRTPAVIELVPTEISLATSCYNCDIPECMMACSYGAIRRDSEGLIRFVYDNCVGCSACVSACPYGVIRYTPPPGSAPIVPKESFLESIPWLGNLFKKPAGEQPADAAAPAAEAPKPSPVLSARGEKVQGKSIKCDLCAGLPFEGCVYNCPTSAISRKDPTSLQFGKDEIRTRVVEGSISDAVHGRRAGGTHG